LVTETSGIVFPTTLRWRTIVTAGGLTYMDEDAGIVSANEVQSDWRTYESNSGGPINGTWPIPNDTPVTIQLWLQDGDGGPLVRGTQVNLTQCNGGTATTEPLGLPPI
jgi:hypothetical protein